MEHCQITNEGEDRGRRRQNERKLTTAPLVEMLWKAMPMIPERGEKIRLLVVEVTRPGSRNGRDTRRSAARTAKANKKCRGERTKGLRYREGAKIDGIRRERS